MQNNINVPYLQIDISMLCGILFYLLGILDNYIHFIVNYKRTESKLSGLCVSLKHDLVSLWIQQTFV